MKTNTVIGIDLAKNVFQIQANDDKGRVVIRRRLSRAELAPFVQQFPLSLIAMEACGGAHFMARKFCGFGHDVRLISPQFVKPFVKGNKNDVADAAAICEAAVRPSMHFVPIKTMWHQDLQAIHRVRSRLSANRTALANQMRGILNESGHVVRQGITPLKRMAMKLVHDQRDGLSPMCRTTIADLLAELHEIEEKIAVNDCRLQETAKQNEVCQRLIKIKGIGKILATALVAAVPEPQVFKNGRQFAAWLGLVPRHSGSGGKNRLGRISKRGDKYLRCLLVHGARSAIRKSEKCGDRLSQWVSAIKERRGYNKAAVALANKNARIIWAMLAKGEAFCLEKAS